MRFWKKFAFDRAQDVVRKPLVYSAHCGACWSQGSHSNSAREISRSILFTSFVYNTNVYWWVFHGIRKKTTFIGGMELVSLPCNRDFTSASSYGIGWYKYAIATQWYQFYTTDAWWFSPITTDYIHSKQVHYTHVFQRNIYASFFAMFIKINDSKHTTACPVFISLDMNIS